MKNELEEYFAGRLSTAQENEMQKYICSHADDEELDSSMRDLFDSCCAAQRPHKIIRTILPCTFAVAAVLALCILLPYSFRKGIDAGVERISSIEWVEVNVPFGEKRVLTLPDSTILHLNAGSRLVYPEEFFGDERKVFISGEAFLDVAKDPEHPFIVNSGDVKVTVRGTSFNFKDFSDSRNVEILLMEGSVKVDVTTPNGVKELFLSPGDKMRYNRVDGAVDISNFSPAKYKTFYEDNSLHFFDVEMTDIAQELSRRFNQKIVVSDEKLASYRYFAIFSNNESLDEILRTMCADGRMRVRRSNGIIFLQPN